MADAGTFGVVDYVVLAAMLSVSASIGVYYACSGGKQTTATEYLLADRKASPLPVAFSLVASFISAITVLGTPAEVYAYGSMYWLYCFAFIGAGFITSLFLHVFVGLTITSANEYLELRFSKCARLIGTAITFITSIFYLAIVIYTPALALNQVTGLNLWGCVIATGVVCTFYTTLGGLKAVLWTDVFQMIVMMAGLLLVIIQGSIELGGLDKAWQICTRGGRIDFWNFDPDPTIRHTFWTVVVGGSFTWGAIYGVSQAQVMRYLSCGRVNVALTALGLAVVGMILVVSAACLAGLVMYAYYATCDPIIQGLVTSPEQLLPNLVIDLFGHLPGLPGLFTAAVFSASLSTVSSGLNALTAVTCEDIIRKIWPNMDVRTYGFVTRIVAFIYGAVCIVLTYAASKLGSILQATLSIGGIFGGPALGVFSLGMFFPWTNNAGAISGIALGLVWSLWVAIGSWIKQIRTPILSLDASGCLVVVVNVTAEITSTMTTVDPQALMTSITMLNMTQPSVNGGDMSAVDEVYMLSYAWLGASSWLVTVFIGLVVSFLTGANDPRKMNPALISPIVDRMYCCLPESWKKPLRCRVGELYEGNEADLLSDQAQVVKEDDKGIQNEPPAYDDTIDETTFAHEKQTENGSFDTKL